MHLNLSYYYDFIQQIHLIKKGLEFLQVLLFLFLNNNKVPAPIF